MSTPSLVYMFPLTLPKTTTSREVIFAESCASRLTVTRVRAGNSALDLALDVQRFGTYYFL
jgi:hypothetical protein